MTEQVKYFPHWPHPSDLHWRVGAVAKAGDKCQALAYTDSRAVYALLDDLGVEWSTHVLGILPAGKEYAVTVALTIAGVTRTDIGQDSDTMSAQARGLKRAAMQFGIFAGLWSLPTVWVAYDPSHQRIADASLAKLNAAYAARYERMVTDNAPPQLTLAPAPPTWSSMADYAAARTWAEESGKFSHSRHVENAWRKLFAQHEAHIAANAAAFLAAWVAYVQQHACAKEPAQPVNG
jgi:hypothetical protein